MTRYADPNRCPDCGHTIDPGVPSCPTCGLPLSGPTARQLFVTLTRADELLDALRSTPQPVPAATRRFVPPTAPGPVQPPVRQRPTLSAASVPKILLTLGAGCLLVAALVFLAVTWSVLGVGGRTATLVAFTVVAGLLAGWMARRGLRAAAEALALVAYGLLTLDVVGADHAGWFGDLDTTGLLVLLGGVLTASGAAGALVVRRHSPVVLVGAEVVTAAGTVLAAYALLGGSWFTPDSAALAATVLAAAVTGMAHRAGLRAAAIGACAVTGTSWLFLAGLAVDRAFEHQTLSELWLHLHVWPLLAAALLVGTGALARALPLSARVSAAAVAHSLVTLAVVAPMLDSRPTTVTLVAIAAMVATAAATRALPRPWGLANALTQAVVAAGLLGVVAEVGRRSAARLTDAAAAGGAGGAGDRLPPVAASLDLPAGWLLPLCLVALLVAAGALVRAGVGDPSAVAVLADRRIGAVLVAASLATALASYPVPLWVVIGLLLLVATGFVGWWLLDGSLVPLASAAVFLAAGVFVSLHAEGLAVPTLAVALALAGLVHLRSRRPELAAGAGAVLALVLAGTLWTTGSLVEASAVWVALTGLVVLGVLVLGAPYAPARWWAARPSEARSGLELGATISAVALGMAGVEDASRIATWSAVYLTVAGVVVTLMALLRADRRQVGWAGGALLALASWVRLWDLGVTAPEAYTLPSATALLAAGLVHLRRQPDTGTLAALGPGLSLALVPSLLWVLEEPTGLRALLLGVACLGLVLAGLRLRWTAPVAVGAAVGALLVLRLAAPYIGDAVPRWVLLGAAGALLIAVGVTWERRLQEARDLLGYVRALR